MLNHITLKISDIKRSKKFYAAALAPLGYKLLIDKPQSAGFGYKGKISGRDFWIKKGAVSKTKSFGCLAFSAKDKKAVKDFYKVALKDGGRRNGAPGYRPKYHVGYYAAFVLDPDGYNIEAVFEDFKKLKKSGIPTRDW